VRIVGIVGTSGSGKTTLIERIVPLLVARGLRVATLKHTHHDVALDDPDDPAAPFLAAGAREVAVVGRHRWALARVHGPEGEPGLDELAARFGPVDLLLVEGFKRHRHPKIEVLRAANGRAPLYPEDPDVVALVTDVAGASPPLPRFALDDAAGVAAFVAGAHPAGARA
jgi:molybdopterin-guanine dinucleotide biosynthesis protein MobB